ncbi:MAG: hypothetical protein LBJ73_05085 [Rickettsiales bacterium]|nr:hypothetical protein [Rickettsiales bacterium]
MKKFITWAAAALVSVSLTSPVSAISDDDEILCHIMSNLISYYEYQYNGMGYDFNTINSMAYGDVCSRYTTALESSICSTINAGEEAIGVAENYVDGLDLSVSMSMWGFCLDFDSCPAGFFSNTLGFANCKNCRMETNNVNATSWGGSSMLNCYIPAGVIEQDETGTFEYTENCYWSGAVLK